jgi:adenosylmethionine---8-amino-7-oxononanoate aminotransferase
MTNFAQIDSNLIWHPFTHQKDKQENIFITHAEGPWLYDNKGNRYLDAISSWWVNLHGHAHPKIAEAIYEQAKKLEHIIFAGFTHEPAVRLAEKLMPLLPGEYAKIFYSDNGSTSTEVALKMSIQYWWNKGVKKNKILAFHNSYHGDTFGAMSVSDRGVFTLAFHDRLFEVVFIDTPTIENISDLRTAICELGKEVACFIYEPLVQGAGGMKMYDATLMDQLLTTAKAQEIICIADEVMTGFGRTGKLFASEYMTHKPDIICLSKGITGGALPLGVTACAAHIYEAYVQDDKLKTFFHGHSFTANPLACASAVASLELLQSEDCQQSIQHITQFNISLLADLATRNLPIRNLRTLGTILAFELDEGRDEYLNSSGAAIGRRAMEQGVYIRPLGNTVYTMPPYCVDEDDLKRIYRLFQEI